MKDVINAIKQICEEKGLEYDAVIATIESALAAAYRKDFGQKNQNIKVEFNDDILKSKIFDVKTVVEDMPEEEEVEQEEEKKEKIEDKKDKKENKDSKKDKDTKKKEDKKEADKDEEVEIEERRFNPKTEIQLTDAKLIKKTAKVGDEIKMKLDKPEAYGRMAAQTAKQVIIQKLREAEREMIFNEFKDKENEVVSGVVQRREGRVILVDLGKAVGIIPSDQQISGETFSPGDRIKVFVKEVGLKPKGPEIILSRTSDEILKKVFYLEIPEISNGLIELKNVAREAGARSKVAVWTDSDNVDPIGSCVGQRGARIQTIISELGGEKVDIIEYDEDPVKFITNSLSPAKIIAVEIDEENKTAVVKAAEDQLSLAIGKGGQNARLAAKLTGWKIDISQIDSDKDKDGQDEETEKEKSKETKKDDKEDEKDSRSVEKEPRDKKEKTDKNKKEDKAADKKPEKKKAESSSAKAMKDKKEKKEAEPKK